MSEFRKKHALANSVIEVREFIEKDLLGRSKPNQAVIETSTFLYFNKDKGHNETTIQFILDQRNIFLEAVSKGPIDYIVDTSTNDSKTIAKKILNDLNFRDYF